VAAIALGWDEIFDQAKAGSEDSIVAFLGVAHALAADAKTVLEVGCGRGGQVDGGQVDGDLGRSGSRAIQDLRGAGRTVIGIDVDPVGVDNPIVDEFRLIPASGRWPLEDASADLAVSDFVLEHVDDAAAFVGELTRVLRPGGAFVARTVSRHSPLSLAARAVPNERHAGLLSRLQPQRQARDVFPTRYRMNSRRDLAALFDADYDWALAHRTGLEQYLLPWPRLARLVAVTEPRLPRSLRTTLVLYARKRGG
jgi:SAM-dependent methyltransferase